MTRGGIRKPYCGDRTLELDKTNIAIRERTYPDILDLALRVVRAHAGPLVVALCAGALPFALLNHWLLAGYLESRLDVDFPHQYLAGVLLLTAWQMPLAGAPATLYLGEALFTRRPRPGQVVRGLRDAAGQLLVYQVLARGWLVPVALWAPAPLAVLAVLALMVFWPYLFTWRPYLNEVVLLERNPLRAPARGAMTTRRRSRILHGGQAGDLFARWLGALGVGVLLFGALWWSMWFGRVLLLAEPEWGAAMWTWCFHLALWTVVGYFTVVRFLSYLDLRIRREGWEVELLVRAEQARLTRQLT